MRKLILTMILILAIIIVALIKKGGYHEVQK